MWKPVGPHKILLLDKAVPGGKSGIKKKKEQVNKRKVSKAATVRCIQGMIRVSHHDHHRHHLYHVTIRGVDLVANSMIDSYPVQNSINRSVPSLPYPFCPSTRPPLPFCLLRNNWSLFAYQYIITITITITTLNNLPWNAKFTFIHTVLQFINKT